MRLFTGVKIPDNIGDELDALRRNLHGGRWIERDAYHITLSFIGKVEGRAIDEICLQLANVRAAGFSLQLSGMGCFGSRQPRALYVHVGASEQLEALQASQAKALASAGVELERRKFIPHVTLARFKQGRRTDVGRFIERNNLFRSSRFDVSRFVLFSARPSGGGGPYAVEASFDLICARSPLEAASTRPSTCEKPSSPP